MADNAIPVLSDVDVRCYIGQHLPQVYVSLFTCEAGESFVGWAVQENISSWFTNMPLGIKAFSGEPVQAGATRFLIWFMEDGAVWNGVRDLIRMSIPDNYMTNGKLYEPTPSAGARFDIDVRPLLTITNVTVSGAVGQPLPAHTATLRVQYNAFREIGVGTDISAWFNLPSGLRALAKEAVKDGDTELLVLFTGTPTEERKDAIQATIPAARFGDDWQNVALSVNPNAKYAIEAAPAPSAKIDDVTVSGTVGSTLDYTFLIRLLNDTFSATVTVPVMGWFGSFPAGLYASGGTVQGGTQMSVHITGTPTEEMSALISLTIPGVYLTSHNDLKTDKNPNAVFDIKEPDAAAAVDDVDIAGHEGEPLQALVTIRLLNDTFNAFAAGADVSAWFLNLPAGLSAALAKQLPNWNAEINISGTPAAPYGAPLQILLPASALARGTAVVVAPNADAKWDILPPKRAATLSDVTVKGSTGRPITEKKLTISLENAAFGAISEGTDISPWILNLPAGLEAKSFAVTDGAESVTVFIGETPEETSGEALRVTIPAARLKNGEAIQADENPAAIFDIDNRTPPVATIGNISVSGEAGKPLPAATARISLAGSTSAQSMGRGQPWNALVFGAGDPSPDGAFISLCFEGGEGDSYYRLFESHSIPGSALLILEVGMEEAILWEEYRGWLSFGITGAQFDSETKTLSGNFAPLTFIDVPDAFEWAGAVFSSGFVPSGSDATGWFRNIPPGVQATVRDFAAGALSVDIDFSGTPTAGSSAAMEILIPAEALNFGEKVLVAPNSSAKWAITATAVSATVGDATVAGTAGRGFVSVPIEISVSGDEFRQMTAGEDCSGWFKNLPAGLYLTAQAGISDKASRAFLLIQGTPGAPKSEAFSLIIPASALYRGAAAAVTANPNAKFAIIAPPAREAALGDLIVSGTTGQPLGSGINLSVSLTGESFGAIAASYDVSGWFKNKPSGIFAITAAAISAGDTSALLAIGGTPEDASESAIILTIPGARLAGGEALTADKNPNAKWNIQGTPSEWYKPGMASTDEAYTNTSSWKASGPDALGGWVYEKGGELTQILPLSGQEVGIPADTPYEYRARAVTLKENGEVLYRSNWCNPRAVLAKGAGIRDVVENAIGTAQILPNAVTIENLNVLAKNAVNNFLGGTKEGWETKGEIVEDAGEGMPVLEIPAPDVLAASNEFDVLPESIHEVKFGVKTIGGTGQLLVGLTWGQTYKRYAYDKTNERWVYTGTGRYFIQEGTGTIKCTTYILGSLANIDDCPPPRCSTDEVQVWAMKLDAPYRRTALRVEWRGSVAGSALRLICPQVYRRGDGRIVAENIYTRTLSAISANLGVISAGLLKGLDAPEPTADTSKLNAFFDLQNNELRVGNDRSKENPDGSPVNPLGDAEYLHFIPGVGFFFKLANFIVTAISSIIKGLFKIARNGQASHPVLFAFNPESAAVDGEEPGLRVGSPEYEAPQKFYGATNFFDTVTLNDTDQSTATDNGALVVRGGVGIKKDLWVGGIIHFPFPGGSGTLVVSLSGAQQQTYNVTQGFYRVVLKGAGGGNSSYGPGYEGGKVDAVFFVVKNAVATCYSGGAGGTGSTDSAGGGGGSSVLDISDVGILFCAQGGAGVNVDSSTTSGGGGTCGGGAGGVAANVNGAKGGNGGACGTWKGGLGGATASLIIIKPTIGEGFSPGIIFFNSGNGRNNVDNSRGGGASSATDGSLFLYRL